MNQVWTARIDAADTEDGLFRLALELESSGGERRTELLHRVGIAIDRLRMRRGLGTSPTIAQLREHWDGPPPADLAAARRDHPDAVVDASMYVETVAGRLRVIPTVTLELPDGSELQLFPSRPRRRGA